MIFKPTEKQVPCPNCGIDIDLDTKKYPMNKTIIRFCPWCGRNLRITKILRIKPKDRRGIEFKLAICHEQHKPRMR